MTGLQYNMPIYEYECLTCGHLFDAMRRISESDSATCPECGKSKANRLMSAPAFHLKGAGWYATDFKDKKPAEQKKPTESGEKPTAKEKTTSKEKPASKQEDS